MNKLMIPITLFLILSLNADNSLSSKFAGIPTSSPEVHDKPPEFLKKFGIEAVASKEIEIGSAEASMTVLRVDFTSSKTHVSSMVSIEIILLSPNNETKLAIENPFTFNNHTVSYRVREGNSLLVIVFLNDNDSVIYTVKFSMLDF